MGVSSGPEAFFHVRHRAGGLEFCKITAFGQWSRTKAMAVSTRYGCTPSRIHPRVGVWFGTWRARYMRRRSILVLHQPRYREMVRRDFLLPYILCGRHSTMKHCSITWPSPVVICV